MRIESAAKTDIGKVRGDNEDALGWFPLEDGELMAGNFFLVADGMGGAQAGEIASALVVESFKEYYIQKDTGHADPVGALREVFRRANREVIEYVVKHPEKRGMGSTGVGIHFDEKSVYVGHVGDSRCYRWRDNLLEPLTRDHSLVETLFQSGKITAEQRLLHPRRSLVTRAIGVEPEVEPDISAHRLKEQDLFLLCSDGFCGHVLDTYIQEMLQKVHRDSSGILTPMAEKLIELIKATDTSDNISVMLIRVSRVTPEEG